MKIIIKVIFINKIKIKYILMNKETINTNKIIKNILTNKKRILNRILMSINRIQMINFSLYNNIMIIKCNKIIMKN